MKKYLLLCTAAIMLISGCTQTDKNEMDSIHSYYDGKPVMVSDVEEFIKIKTMMYEVADIDDDEYAKINLDEIDSSEKWFDFMEYRQYQLVIQWKDFYFGMTKEEKEQDYYVALEKIDYYTKIFIENGEPDKIDNILELNRYIVFDNPEYSSIGVEVNNRLADMAKDKGISFEAYVEQYYLPVALEMELNMYVPVKFCEEKYGGEIPVYPDVLQVTHYTISDEKLTVIAQDLDEYYSFIEIAATEFYEYILEQSMEKMTQ